MIVKKSPETGFAYNILDDAISNTPDWNTLKKSPYDEFVVMVTGNTRKSKVREDFMTGCNYYGQGVTFHDNFLMKRTNLLTEDQHPEPYVFHMEKDDWDNVGGMFSKKQMKQVEGDVFGVPLRKLTLLDKYEANGEGIKRIETWIKLKHPLQKGANLKAFMYVIDTKMFTDTYGSADHLMNCAYVYEKGTEAYYHV
ncbi:hypothetical protein EVB79_044 [Rhizobium phage RHph_N3_13]|nr:hypothetical protein EVB79_044 [Rhizobium phage RHph_N3_13]QIG69870.1 hypothetical protein F67_I3_11_044 [Rhizobium phage RHph_I3_11]